MQLAVENDIKTIAFPCISTGAYRFPFDKAAMIAIKTVTHFLNKNSSIEKVFFVVFKEKDLSIYKRVFNNFQQ